MQRVFSASSTYLTRRKTSHQVKYVRTVASDLITRPTNSIGLIGIKEDRNSSFMRGTAEAPVKIRECFNCDSSNSWSELKIDVSKVLCDYGDFTPKKDFLDVEEKIQAILGDHRLPLTLGGDHSISAPVFNAIQNFYNQPITIVHFDAHPDLYPLFQENPHSHASPFARILEKGNCCKKLISLGIRTINEIQAKQIEKYHVEVVEAKDFPAKGQ